MSKSRERNFDRMNAEVKDVMRKQNSSVDMNNSFDQKFHCEQLSRPKRIQTPVRNIRISRNMDSNNMTVAERRKFQRFQDGSI